MSGFNKGAALDPPKGLIPLESPCGEVCLLGMMTYLKNKSTIYGKRLSCDECGIFFCEEADGVCDIFGCSEAGKRCFFCEGIHDIFIVAGVHIRINDAGGDAVNTDVRGGKLLGKSLSEADDGSFGGGISHLSRSTRDAPHGGNGDDTSAACCDHFFGGGLAEEERALHIDAEERIVFFLARLREKRGKGDARTGDERIDFAEGHHRFGDGAAAIGGAFCVHLERNGMRAVCFCLFAHGKGSILAALIADEDIVAVFGKFEGTRSADATGCARDDYTFSCHDNHIAAEHPLRGTLRQPFVFGFNN